MDKLGLYNLALSKIGAERLSSLTEDTERRYRLDDVYDSSVLYCLQISKPFSSSKVVALTTATGRAANTYGYEYTLPTNYIDMVGTFADANLDQELGRSFIQGRKLVTDSKTPFIRYISSDVSESSPTFIEVLASYLAKEIAPVFVPDRVLDLTEMFQGAVSAQLEINAELEKAQRTKKSGNTLTPAWKNIFNDSIQILGLPNRITSLNESSETRDAFETALSAGLILNMIEGNSWQWCSTNQKLWKDPSLEPEWGYEYVYATPDDLVRFDGIYSDENLRNKIIHYHHEDKHLFMDGWDEIYIKYISTKFTENPDAWPPSFKRYVAAKLAEETALVLNGSMDNALRVLPERKQEAENNDALQSPPELIEGGSWSQSRRRGTHTNQTSGYIPNADR